MISVRRRSMRKFGQEAPMRAENFRVPSKFALGGVEQKVCAPMRFDLERCPDCEGEAVDWGSQREAR